MAELGPGDFPVAFAFARSEAAPYRSPDGVQLLAPVDVPRFDHTADGVPLGLLVGSGSDIGREDRLAIDPLILPAALVEAEEPRDREATVFHRWLPDGAAVERYDAWYTRNTAAAIDALVRQAGHHRTIGVTRGFAVNRGGEVRLRTRSWRAAGYLLASSGRVLTDGGDALAQPLIVGGPMPVS